MTSDLLRFRDAYATHRAREGRGADDVLALPYAAHGPMAAAWRVRARSYEHFMAAIVAPRAAAARRPLRVVDLGAGNGWLCARLARAGHDALAMDIRDDDVDGLGAAPVMTHGSRGFERVVASFEMLPLPSRSYDLAVFNASLHYALELGGALSEAARVTVGGGAIVIIDSPFYEKDADGAAMVAAKRSAAAAVFGAEADALMALPCIEYLTRERLETASRAAGLVWRRHRVRYPLRYEARPLIAALLRRRAPSRFDVWEAQAP